MLAGRPSWSLEKMKDTWLKNKSKEIQTYADTKNSKKFYNTIKVVYGPQTSGASPILSADGSTLFTEKEEILDRWAEHFQNVLNRPSTVNEEVIDRLPQVEVNTSLSDQPTLEETAEAISLLSNGKATGPDAIPAEVYMFRIILTRILAAIDRREMPLWLSQKGNTSETIYNIFDYNLIEREKTLRAPLSYR